MALITLTEYKAFYGITTTTDDTINQLLIDSAEDLITNFLGRSLAVANYTEIHDGGTSTIILDASPVISISEILILSTSEPVIQYALYADTGILSASKFPTAYYSRLPTFRGGIQDLRVSYSAGYATIPNEIKYCAYILTKKLATDKTAAASTGVKRQRLHGEDREYFKGSDVTDTSQIAVLGSEVISILQKYM